MWAARGCEADFRTKLQAVCYKEARKEKNRGSSYSYFGRHSKKTEHSTENLSQNVFQSPLHGHEDYQSDPNACKQSGMRSTYCAQAAKNTDLDHWVPVILTLKEA